jgi:hypothetical protein
VSVEDEEGANKEPAVLCLLRTDFRVLAALQRDFPLSVVFHLSHEITLLPNNAFSLFPHVALREPTTTPQLAVGKFIASFGEAPKRGLGLASASKYN